MAQVLPNLPKDPDLQKLLAEAQKRMDAMSPEDRASMFASQKIGWVMAEMCMAVHEEQHSSEAAVRYLAETLRVLAIHLGNDEPLPANFSPILLREISLLNDHDCVGLRQRIEQMMYELQFAQMNLMMLTALRK